VTNIPVEHTSHFAATNYKAEVARLIASKTRPEVVEIGAGRNPQFSNVDLPKNVKSYTIGDISQKELDQAPGSWNTLCFDVCGDVSSISAQLDLAVTRMLAEHVLDGFRRRLS